MAIKPIIYKLRIALSDLERNYYDTLSLTIALHPSETAKRMMARVIAYCINAQKELSFTKGLSEVEAPDLWVRNLDDKIALWIDVGEPSVERIKKASRIAQQTRVYSFNTKSEVWWQQIQNKVTQHNVCVVRLEHDKISQLADMLERTMDMSVTITGESAYITTKVGELELGWETLYDK